MPPVAARDNHMAGRRATAALFRLMVVWNWDCIAPKWFPTLRGAETPGNHATNAMHRHAAISSLAVDPAPARARASATADRSPGDAPLPVVRVDPLLSRAARREAWQELTRPLFAVAPLTEPGDFQAAWAMHRLDRLIVSQVEFTAQEFVHDPRVSQHADDALLLLELYEAGTGRGLSGGTPTLIDDRRIHLVDLSRGYRSITSQVRTIGVVIPHAAVHFDPARHPPYLALPLATPRGAMLAAALRGLVSQLPAATIADAPALAEAFAALVRALFLLPEPPEPASPSRAHQGERIRRYMDQHLASDLDAGELARRFGLSRASLYRLFQADGGIEAYLRDRRLERCSIELMQALPERGRVREIAERLGFSDAGHFTRAFRQRFGVAPTEHLGARHRLSADPAGSHDLPASHASVRLFGDWLRRQVAAAPHRPD